MIGFIEKDSIKNSEKTTDSISRPISKSLVLSKGYFTITEDAEINKYSFNAKINWEYFSLKKQQMLAR